VTGRRCESVPDLAGHTLHGLMQPSRDISRLIEIMALLRTQGSGCQWDLAQTFETIVPYTIEEAYEVADAVARSDHVDLREELGDLLLQVVFHARLAEEFGFFDFGEVVAAITDKMIRRHPNVFGEAQGQSIHDIESLWSEIKAKERSAKSTQRDAIAAVVENDSRHENDSACESILDGITLALPGLTRAVKLQERAAAVGFDWGDPRLVLAKIREETDEIEAALDGDDRDAVNDEIGDLFFAVANLARHLRSDPEANVRRANDKFERRFRYIEQELGRAGRECRGATLEEMDALWCAAKTFER
jgi:ATP diphosphatase